MIKNRSDFAAGLLFVGVGLFYGMLSLDLSLGTALDMGPGYFPLVLCGILVLLGIGILGTSFVWPTDETFGKVPWRALVMLPLAIVVFGVFLPYLGLFPAVFVTALIASLSSRDVPWTMMLAVSVSLAIFCTVVFSYGVRLHIPIFGSWFV